MEEKNNSSPNEKNGGWKEKVSVFAKKVFKWKYLIFAVAILLSFGSEVVAMGNEVGMRVVLTSIGIDRTGDEYTVSAQVFTPQLDETKTQIKSVVSVTAPTISEAMNHMNLRTGKIATISHCRLLVLGDSIMQENILKPLNYFFMNNQISWGAIVVASSGKAEDTLNGLNTLEQKASFSWQKFLNSNREHDVVTVMSLRELLLRSDDIGGTALINVLDVKESRSQSGGGSSGGSGGAAEGGGGGSAGGGEVQKGQLELGKRTLVVQKGNLKGDLNPKEVRGYSWLDKKVDKAVFTVEGVDDPMFEGAKTGVRMRKRKLRCRYGSENGKPRITIVINALFDNVEILRAEHAHIMTTDEVEASSAKLQEAIEQEIIGQIEAAHQKSLEIGADILNLNERFYRFKTSLYDKYGEDTFREAVIDYEIRARLSL